MRILLVEDDAVVRHSIMESLEETGHMVVAVADGRQALETGRVGKFDLLVTDLVMPQLTGLGLIKLGHEEGWLSYPVVIMTAYEKRKFLEIEGVVAVLSKPTDPADVARLLQTMAL